MQKKIFTVFCELKPIHARIQHNIEGSSLKSVVLFADFLKCLLIPNSCRFEVQWSLYFTTLHFETTLIIRPYNLIGPKCIFVCYGAFILRTPTVYDHISIVPWVVLKQRDHCSSVRHVCIIHYIMVSENTNSSYM